MLFLLLACEPTDPKTPIDTDTGWVVSDGDEDGDGYLTTEGDCNDQNGTVHPGSVESCNGLDDNCDGAIDEGVMSTFYQDADGDGFGDPAVSQEGCEVPEGFTGNNQDCNDVSALIYPGADEVCDGLDNNCDGNIDENLTSIWYADGDGDGYGNPDLGTATCIQPDGYVADNQDCDDGSPAVYPGSLELCDELDNDCDGLTDEGMTTTWYADLDGDGYGDASASQESCGLLTGYVSNNQDCDDGNVAANPGVVEVCDGADNDCDGAVDESDASDAQVWYADLDGDGFGDATTGMTSCSQPLGYISDATDCNDASTAAYPGATEVCDGLDNDCDGSADEPDASDAATWYADGDGDGYGDSRVPTTACSQPAGYVSDATDCDDYTALANPGEVEVCDGLDNDCSGLVDDNAIDAYTWYWDGDGDGYGDAGIPALECDLPYGYVATGTDCDDAHDTAHPGATEVCDGLDNDCDGVSDESDAVDALEWYLDGDGDGFGGTSQIEVACTQPVGFSDNSEDCEDGDATIHPDADEWCDGIDNNCDGEIDEDTAVDADTWYIDLDNDQFGDGRYPQSACAQPSGYVTDSTDCNDLDDTVYPGADEVWFDGIDSDCDGLEDPNACDEAPPDGTIGTDSTCTYTPTLGSFNPVTEWSSSNYTSYTDWKHVLMTPVVGDLTGDEVPDVAIVTFNRTTPNSAGVLRLLSGDDGTVLKTVYGATYGSNTYYPYRYSSLALGDIDLDGTPDIVATLYNTNGNCYVGAYNTTGTLKWVYTTDTVGCRSNAPALADLEGDGDVEVIMGHLILNGSNGSKQGKATVGAGYYSAYSNSGYHSFPIDIDGDGDQEVITGAGIYGSTGATVCSTGTADGYPSAADLDNDGDGEFIVVAGGTVRVFSHTCTQVTSWSVYGGGYGGPATIADFDGDGTPEIGIAGDDYYSVYEANGTRLWAKAIQDASSHSTGSSVFDFDGDGVAEVVYADETTLWVLSGPTGAVLLEETSHNSGTVNEYPVIADVDADGNAEIVMPNDNTTTALMVLGDRDDNWVIARQVWNQHAYNITNINDDLSIPTVPDSNWPDYNSFRQGGTGSFGALDAPDGSVTLYGPCQDSCGSDVEVLAQVENDGLVLLGATVELALFCEDSNGVETELERVALGSTLASGERALPVTFTLTAAEAVACTSLVVRIDPDGAENECDESNNEASISPTGVCQ